MAASKTERIPFRGGLTCICVVTSLPLVEQDMISRGLIKRNIDIFQLGYNNRVGASAGTHKGGGNTDVGQFSDAQLAVWRGWGWTMQRRNIRNTPLHGHGWPRGCPHLSAEGRSQARSWERGQNGLVGNGPILGPGPKGPHTPTWQEALGRRHTAGLLDSEGFFPMTKATAVKLRRTTDFPLKKGNFVTVPIDEADNVTIMNGPARFCVAATISVSGLRPGSAVHARFVIADFKKGEKTTTHYAWPHVVIPAAANGAAAGQVVIPFDSFQGGTKGHTRRLRLQLSSPTQDATVTDIQIRAGKA